MQLVLSLLQDNKTCLKSELIKKLAEETQEAQAALWNYKANGEPYRRDEAVAETLDVVQVCVGLLQQLQVHGADMETALRKHNMKLRKRGHRTAAVALVEIMRYREVGD